MYLPGVFLSTHLHDPCLCRRGHDLSNEDNIVWLWLLEIHGPLALGTGKVVGNMRTLGATTRPVRQLWPTTQGIGAVTTSILLRLG